MPGADWLLLNGDKGGAFLGFGTVLAQDFRALEQSMQTMIFDMMGQGLLVSSEFSGQPLVVQSIFHNVPQIILSQKNKEP